MAGTWIASGPSPTEPFDATEGSFGGPRTWRPSLIDGSHAMLVIRAELSESGAYEIAYNVHAGPRVPSFFAVHQSCPIRTTLLQELDELVEARYQLFTQPGELIEALHRFLTSCNAGAASFAPSKARH